MKEKYNEIINWLRQYQRDTSLRGVVLGISGGKDSTVVAELCARAFGADNVIGVLMPNGDQHDIGTSYDVIKEIGIRYIYVNIMDFYKNIPQKFICHEKPDWTGFTLGEKTRTNIPPRLRMMVLYAIAQENGYRVAGTGNLSERYIGWCTKHGDMACDFNPIAHLTCTEVIALGDYLGISEALVHKTPADGLTNKSDEENFGFTYAQLDMYIKGDREHIPLEIVEKIERMHKFSQHKRELPAMIDVNLNVQTQIKRKSLWHKLTSFIQDLQK